MNAEAVADGAFPLCLFARAPVPARVKTRMQPALTPQQCARLAHQMLEHSMQKIVAAWPGKRLLYVTPNVDHPLIVALSRRYGFALRAQVGADLGARLADAMGAGIRDAGGAVVLGGDVPQLPQSLLADCHAGLGRGQPAVGPATDGGFYLLALCGRDMTLPAALFENIAWGECSVLRGLLDNARRLGVELARLPMLRDIDTYADLVALADEMACYRRFLTAGSDTGAAHGRR